MLAQQRQASILDRVRRNGGARVADLVRVLGVSDMTIRRDIEALAERGLVAKVHGGAIAIEGTTDEIANDFRGWHRDVHAIIRNINAPFKWALMVRRPMDCWSKGRIALLGDACHPTLPFLGQGAVMAIEDAYVLAACLEKYFNHPALAFARYEDIRKDRTAAVVRKAHENRRQAFSPTLADDHAIAASVEREWQQVRMRERLDWLYAYDATAVQI